MKKKVSKHALTILILLLLFSMLGVGFISFASKPMMWYPLDVDISVDKRVPIDTVVEVQVQINSKTAYRLCEKAYLKVNNPYFEYRYDDSYEWTNELSFGYDLLETDFTKGDYYQSFSMRLLPQSLKELSEDDVQGVACILEFKPVDGYHSTPGEATVYYVTDGEYIAFSTKSEEEALMRLNMPTIILTVVIVAICVVAATILAIILIIKRKKRISE